MMHNVVLILLMLPLLQSTRDEHSMQEHSSESIVHFIVYEQCAVSHGSVVVKCQSNC